MDNCLGGAKNKLLFGKIPLLADGNVKIQNILRKRRHVKKRRILCSRGKEQKTRDYKENMNALWGGGGKDFTSFRIQSSETRVL